MKRIMCVAAMLAAVGSVAWGGHLLGPQEVSLSGQFGSLKRESETTVGFGADAERVTVSNSSRYMTLAARYGLFVYYGLEIEPEVYWTAIEDRKPAVSLHECGL